LAEHLEVAEDEVLEGLAAASSRLEVSLDQPVGGDGDACLGDLMLTPGAREEPEDLLALPGLVAALPELEREIILLRFFQNLDQYEIAARVGCSQMHISRLQRRALARMRAQLVEPWTDVLRTRSTAWAFGRRISTETKAAYKTTEFAVYVVVFLGILLASFLVKTGQDGERVDYFRAD
jgi:hypothetical protein